MKYFFFMISFFAVKMNIINACDKQTRKTIKLSELSPTYDFINKSSITVLSIKSSSIHLVIKDEKYIHHLLVYQLSKEDMILHDKHFDIDNEIYFDCSKCEKATLDDTARYELSTAKQMVLKSLQVLVEDNKISTEHFLCKQLLSYKK